MSTRASLKKYHTFNLILGLGEHGDGWEFERIGTEREKLQTERELQELRERLAQVGEWKRRRQDIEDELARVWTDRGEAVEAPAYVQEGPAGKEREGEEEEEGDVVS